MKRLLVRLVLVLLAGYFSTDIASGQKSELFVDGLAPVPIAAQKKLGTCDFNNSQTLSLGRVYLETQKDGSVTLRGKNDEGKPWTSSYAVAPGAGCELWEANLDPNTSALFLLSRGMDSSGGWDTTLSILYFDDAGNPFPWQADGYVEVTPRGLANVVRLEDTRGVGVIIATREMGSSAIGHNKWAHRDEFRLYKLSQDGMNEIKGLEQGIRWPFEYENAKDSWGSRSARYDLSVSHRTTSGVLAEGGTGKSSLHKVEGIRAVNGTNPEIVLSDGKEPFPDLLVVDSASGRNIISNPTMSDVSGLKISNATAEKFGDNCTGDACHAVVIWIK
jgi:hypothetical protein